MVRNVQNSVGSTVISFNDDKSRCKFLSSKKSRAKPRLTENLPYFLSSRHKLFVVFSSKRLSLFEIQIANMINILRMMMLPIRDFIMPFKQKYKGQYFQLLV